MKDFWVFPGPKTILGVETERFEGTDLTDVGRRWPLSVFSKDSFFFLTTFNQVLLFGLLTTASCSPRLPLPSSGGRGGSRRAPSLVALG